MSKLFEIQKIYSKRYSSLCANADHGVTTFEADGLKFENFDVSKTVHDFCMK